MSLIIKDGIKYASGTNLVELTQAQYDALTSAQKNNGNIYLISDTSKIMEKDSQYSSGSLSGLTDTNIDSSTSVGQVIAFNGTEWINSNSVITLTNKVNQFTDWTDRKSVV